MSCDSCSKFFSKKRQPTPCGACPKPILESGNFLVWEIFEETATQVRTAGMGSVIGFDYASLPMFFTAYEIPQSEWWLYLKKLNVVYAIALQIWNKKDTPTK